LHAVVKPRVLVLTVALATLLAACGSSSKSGSSGSGSSGASVTLNGSGSTFQANFDAAVITAFKSADSNITINYQGVGSGQGKTDLQSKTTDFAGTDSLPKPADLPSYQGGKVLYFPTVAAPITVSYNVSGVTGLKLSDKTLAKIFATKVTKWDDSAIAADNPGVKLPSTSITVVHRADGSGTTHNFTEFLNTVDPTDWTLGSGDTVDWPSSTQAGTGNPGVAQDVQQTSGAIGYVDLADATKAKLSFASIQNKSGNFVAPTLAGASAAVAGSTFNADLSYDPINAAGAATYPITSPTWIIAYETQPSHDKGTALQSYLNFIYGEGQSVAKSAGYSALPAAWLTQVKNQVKKLKIPAS